MSELLQEAAPCQRQATDVQKYIFFIGTQQPCHADAGLCDGGHLWLRFVFPLPFLLKEKEQKFKADIIGPNTQSGRFPAMSAVARAPDPVNL